jgi:ankyrin repeat protein
MKPRKERPLSRAVSNKVKSIQEGFKPSKKSKSNEHITFHKNTYDHRLPSITDKKELNNCITIDPQEINKIHSNGETLLLWAARNNNTPLIEQLLTYEDVSINYKNHYSQTALHYIAQNKNEKIIKKLLLNPQTDASIYNNKNKTAREMVNGTNEHDVELRRIIFARIMLDLTVNNTCNELKDRYAYACHIATIDSDEEKKEVIQTAIEMVKKAILNDQNNQQENDRDLPESAKLPDYADDNFIEQMIVARITKDSV